MKYSILPPQLSVLQPYFRLSHHCHTVTPSPPTAHTLSTSQKWLISHYVISFWGLVQALATMMNTLDRIPFEGSLSTVLITNIPCPNILQTFLLYSLPKNNSSQKWTTSCKGGNSYK